MFDDIFGGLFDFNGDGETDPIEFALGMAILDECDNNGEGPDDDDLLLDDDLDDDF